MDKDLISCDGGLIWAEIQTPILDWNLARPHPGPHGGGMVRQRIGEGKGDHHGKFPVKEV